MDVLLVAQDGLGGAAGWSSFGIAGLVLAWLLLRHLPEKDKREDKRIDDHRAEMKGKDELIEKVLARHVEAVEKVVAHCQAQGREQQQAGERWHAEQMAMLAKLHETDREVVHAVRGLAQQMGLKQRLADAWQSLERAAWTKALDGTLMSWNSSAERLLGWPQGEVVGKSVFHRIIPADRTQEEEQVLLRIGRGEVVPEYETERKAKNGRLVPLRVVTSPIRDQSGQVIGASTIAREIEAD